MRKGYLYSLGLCWCLIGIMAHAEYQTEYETEYETEYQTEEIWESEKEEVWEEETEKQCIWIKNIRLAYEGGIKEYDGTTEAALQAEVVNLPSGGDVYLIAYTESPDVGEYVIQPEVIIDGIDTDIYEVKMEETELILSIAPKPLTILISDARKMYFSENDMDNLYFEEMNPVDVTGFVADENQNLVIPEEFVLPEIVIDETVLKKNSCMYQYGSEKIYKDAITVRKDEKGQITGNPTKNYCFMETPEFLKKGSVVLTQGWIQEGKDYEIISDYGYYRDPNGAIWVRPGDTLRIVPKEGRGFSYCQSIGPLQVGGTEEFSLYETNGDGEIVAESQINSVSWNVDAEAPGYKILLNGETNVNEINYSNKSMVLQVQGYDKGSQLKAIHTYLAKNQEIYEEPEELYGRTKDKWTSWTDMALEEEGEYCLYVRLEDQVGNTTYGKSGVLVYDLTQPVIWIENVEDGSANNKTVMPVIQAYDEHLAQEKLSYTLTGIKGGKKQSIFQRKKADGQETLEMWDFPYDESWDDVYHLKVTAEDMAGNVAEQTIRFSVNRFGSTYYLDEEMSEKLQTYYLKTPVEVLIHEVNVDELTETEIMLGYEDSIRVLEKDVDYTIIKSGNRDNWKEYTYVISADVFDKDGYYYITCSSRDRAKNQSDIRFEKNIEFVIDQSPPDILLYGIKDGGQYDKEREVKIEAMDNIGVSRMQILVDGKCVGNGKDSQVIILKEKEGTTDLKIQAWDLAGNQSLIRSVQCEIGNFTDQKSETEEADEEQETEKGQGLTENDFLENGMDIDPTLLSDKPQYLKKLACVVLFLGLLKGILWIRNKVN